MSKGSANQIAAVIFKFFDFVNSFLIALSQYWNTLSRDTGWKQVRWPSEIAPTSTHTLVLPYTRGTIKVAKMTRSGPYFTATCNSKRGKGRVILGVTNLLIGILSFFLLKMEKPVPGIFELKTRFFHINCFVLWQKLKTINIPISLSLLVNVSTFKYLHGHKPLILLF